MGITNDLLSRLKEHKSGRVYFTSFDPDNWRFVYCEVYLSRKDAAEREQRLKDHGRAFRQLKERIEDSLHMAK